MFKEEDMRKLKKFIHDCNCNWAWIDAITTMGPTKLENFFKEFIDGEFFNHWSPATPEGYLEIKGGKNVVIHWIIGEEDKIVNATCLEEVDFDEIDKSLASTIIHNSVIRILSDNF